MDDNNLIAPSSAAVWKRIHWLPLSTLKFRFFLSLSIRLCVNDNLKTKNDYFIRNKEQIVTFKKLETKESVILTLV